MKTNQLIRLLLLPFLLIINSCGSISINEELINASSIGWPSVVQSYIDQGADVNAKGSEGITPLMAASYSGSIKSVRILINHGAKVNDVNDINMTSLHYSSITGNFDIAKVLLDAGADPNIFDSKGYSPLLLSMIDNYLNIANLLLDYGADVNVNTKYGYTPLHCACYHGYTNFSERLITNGSNINSKEKYFYHTPLMYASGFGHADIVKQLIYAGADLNATSTNECTAIMMAVEEGFEEIVELLKTAGAEIPPQGKKCNQSTKDFRLIIEKRIRQIDSSLD